MRRYILLILLIGSVVSAGAFNKAIVDSLEMELGRATTLRDSARISLDLMDAAPSGDVVRRCEFALPLARRSGNTGAELEIFRRLASVNADNDSLFGVYIDEVKSLPESDVKSQTILYMSILRNRVAAQSSSPDECRAKIQGLMRAVEMSGARNLHTRIQVLFALSTFVEQLAIADLLSNYLDSVGVMIGKLPQPLDELRILYLSQVASTDTSMGNPEEGVAGDRALLAFIDSVKAREVAGNRPFRNYSMMKYEIYRRMLGNYKAMSAEEAAQIYAAARAMAAEDPAAMADLTTARRPDIYYMMSQGEYGKVKPLLRVELEEGESVLPPYVKRLLLQILFEAGERTDDRNAMFEALMGLQKLDNSEKLRQNSEQLKALQFIYDDNMAKLAKADMVAQRHRAERQMYRNSMFIGAVLIVVLIVLMLLQVKSSRRTKSLNMRLAEANDRLKRESDSLRRTQTDLIRASEKAKAADRQKAEFINNMSHEVSAPLNAIVEYSQLLIDCVEDEQAPYLSRFGDVIKQNTDIVLMLVNDVLDLASIDRKELKMDLRPTDIGAIAQVAADTIASSIAPGVQLVNRIEVGDDELITTDGKRVGQVLLNLLANAAKFTKNGSITLEGGLVDGGANYRFAITDTGVGIPKGKEEVIFERFKKLDSYSPGLGLGLSVSRMVATQLGGTVRVDTGHKGPGARFVFTIPAK